MKLIKRCWILILAVTMLLFPTACSDGQNKTQEVEDLSATSLLTDRGSFRKASVVTDFVCIQLKNGGRILIELYPDVAPDTVSNFKKLVGQGFYDGLIFHRVISGFMIQGGCPEGTGYKGPGWSIKGEFAANGYENNLSHERGVVSMARGEAYNSAGSQFFIMHADNSALDGKYAAFGRVIHGMDLVDQIAKVQTNANDRPLTDQVMESVYFMSQLTGEGGEELPTATAEPAVTTQAIQMGASSGEN